MSGVKNNPAEPKPMTDADVAAEIASDPSLGQLAAFLITPAAPEAAKNDAPSNDGATNSAAPAGAAATASNEGNSDGNALGSDGAADADLEEIDFFADPEGSEQAVDPAQLTDDLKLTVTVDGKETQVTLGELRRNYSGEKAIAGRLQEATEARNAAKAELASVQAEATAERARLAKAMSALQQMLLTPRVKLPDPALQRTDAAKYLLQMEHYRQDQARLASVQSTINKALETVEEDKARVTEAQMEQEMQKLLTAIPAMRDPQKAPVVQSTIMEAATAAGFSLDEIKGAVDHRLFVLAMKAGLYDKLMARRTSHQQVQQKETVLPTGAGGNSATVKGARQQPMRQRAPSKPNAPAGSVDAVAASLIIQARN